MGQALYRKYRSKNLAEIAGQEHITRTLTRAIENNTISHAYLFTGPRGVGKTSVARILAHEINDLPYTDETSHLDIIEIDAASNRRIDEIRDLRDKVHIAPTSAKYKVYIIDEVHMLTREAFNALLKTLEEPPAHVVFILATTEIHKLPETIISRTQRFTFKAIDPKTATEHLRAIAKSEKIKIDDEALMLLAEHSKGSFRDSISLLDQVGHSADSIKADDVRALIGLASNIHIQHLYEAVISSQPKSIIEALGQCVADGVNAAQAAKQLSEYTRQQIISGEIKDTTVLVDLLGDLVGVPASSDPDSALEIALFRAQLNTQPTPSKPATQVSISTPAIVKSTKAKKDSPAVKQERTAPAPLAEVAEKTSETLPTAITEEVAAAGEPAEWWDEVLQHIKTVNNTLYGVLRMAVPTVDNDTLHLSFGFGFHKRKAANAETQAKIHEAITKVTGSSYRINAIYDKNLAKNGTPTKTTTQPVAEKSPEKPTDNELHTVTNIFGGGEVLES